MKYYMVIKSEDYQEASPEKLKRIRFRNDIIKIS